MQEITHSWFGCLGDNVSDGRLRLDGTEIYISYGFFAIIQEETPA